MGRYKDMVERAKDIAKLKQIEKKLKKADGSKLILLVQDKAEDMQLLVKNFGMLLKHYHITQMELFKIQNKDKIKIGLKYINKDEEIENYKKVCEWFEELKKRW